MQISRSMLNVNGEKAWLGLGLYILLYDTWALVAKKETLSETFYKAFVHPKHRWVPISIFGIVTLHLIHRLPRRLDPFHLYAVSLQRITALHSNNISLTD